MRSQVIRVRNLPSAASEKPFRIQVRPTAALLIGAASGIALSFAPQNFFYAGFALCVICLFGLFLPDRTLCAFYKDYLVLYNQMDPGYAAVCYWDEVVRWHYEYHRKYDLLVVEMVDGSTQTADFFSKRRLARGMALYAPGKEDKTRKGKGEKA